MANAYVKTELHPDLPPPSSESGRIKWLRDNLFNNWYNSIATILIFYLAWLSLPPIIDWALISPVWEATSNKDCPRDGGACWGMIDKRIGQFMYGFYEPSERWRPDLALILFIVAMAPILFDKLPGRDQAALFIIFIYPAIGIVLVHGPIEIVGMSGGGGLVFWGVLFAAAAGYGFWSAADTNPGRATLSFAVAGLVAFMGFLSWGFGLPVMETSSYGGLLLTLILAGVSIAVALPLGILLALGRRADSMPIVQMLCIGFIEIVRAVPLISVLFMAQFMLPLFLPEGVNFDNVVRALVGMSFFAAAYMAEVIRGGLQAIPKGQFEAADSLGLNYYLSMRLIVLPQALKIVIPGIVSTFIGLFKDTTLVSIIGLSDILLVGKQSVTDSKWLGLEHEAYFFVALVYFVFCFGMSRYSMYLEVKLHTGHKR